MKIAPVDLVQGRAAVLGAERLAAFIDAEDIPGVEMPHGLGGRDLGNALQFIAQTQGIQNLVGIGPQCDAGADLAQLRRALVDDRGKATLAQGNGEGEPAKTSANDGDAGFGHGQSFSTRLRNASAVRLQSWGLVIMQ